MMTTEEVLAHVRPNILSLEPYSTARDEYRGELGILLDANESPFGDGLNRYPARALRECLLDRISAIKHAAPDCVFLGNGSDECIDLCYRLFCTPGQDNALMIAPSYGMYRVCADINDVQARQVLLGDDFSLPVDELLGRADSNSKLLFLCSPNNPTGNAFPTSDIIRLLEGFPGIVVLDEAYADFSDGGSLAALLKDYPNLIILQTLSKACGMAGLRIGIALASREIITLMDRVRYPYNIGTDTLGLAIKLLGNNNLQENIRTIIRERERLASALEESPAFSRVFPSDANFILARTDEPKWMYDFLLERGIIVRDRSNAPLCNGCLRFTVGSPEENERLLKAISDYSKTS